MKGKAETSGDDGCIQCHHCGDGFVGIYKVS